MWCLVLYLLKNISTNKYLGDATPIVEDIQGQTYIADYINHFQVVEARAEGEET